MTKQQLQDKIQIVKSFLPQLNMIDESKFSMERQRGTSNVTYRVKIDDQHANPNTIILRQFSHNTEGIINRSREIFIFDKMSELQFGPSNLGCSSQFRVEQNIDSVHPTKEVMKSRQFYVCLAEKLVQVHSIKIPSNFQGDTKQFIFGGGIFDLYKEKVSKSEIFTEDDHIKLAQMEVLIKQDEIKWLIQLIDDYNGDQVFCHNDLNANNIFYDEQLNQIFLIDFEFSGYNLKGFDIASYLNEMEYDYNYGSTPFFQRIQEYSLNQEQIDEFLSYYLFFQLIKAQNVQFDRQILSNFQSMLEFVDKNFDINEFQKGVKKLFIEYKIGQLINHYYWMVESVIVSKMPDVDFDHVDHAYDRFNQYNQLKPQLIELLKKN